MAFFLTCLFIDILNPFSLKVESFDTYYYLDSNGSKQISPFFYFTASEFSHTLFGQIILSIMVPFLNLFLSVLVGIVLNIVSVNLYRSYIRERRERVKGYARASLNQTNNELDIQVVVVPKSKKLSRKEVDENKAESNMFSMALTLCSLSILSRILIILIYIYLFCSMLYFYLNEGVS